MSELKTIKQIFVEYLDTQELVYEYMRENPSIYKQDEEGEYSPLDERDAVDTLLEGIVNTMPIGEFFGILEEYINVEIENFFLSQGDDLFKKFKFEVLADSNFKKVMNLYKK